MEKKRKMNLDTKNRADRHEVFQKDVVETKKRLRERDMTCYNGYEHNEPGEYEAFWQSLTITDDFIFGKIMLDPQICIELLRLIFPKQNIERIEYVKTQESRAKRMDPPSEFIGKLEKALYCAK